MKGGKNGDLTEGATDIDIKVKVDMFQIPLLFKAGATEDPCVRSSWSDRHSAS